MANENVPGFITNANQAFFDALIRHQIFLLRYSGSLREQINDILNKTEKDIQEEILKRMSGSRSGPTPANIKRMKALLKVIRAIRTEAWTEIDGVWAREMQELAKSEPKFIDGVLKTVSPAVLDTVLPSPELLRSIVTQRPFEGKVLAAWAKEMREVDIKRIEDQIKIGMVQGESSQQIARRVLGSSKLKGMDGATQLTRKGAESITRTAINAISNQAKREYYKENADIFDKELYSATLDARTTPVCRSLDGKIFPIGKGPIPPLHFNCRSVRIALITPEAIGKRPAREFTKKQLLREYAEERGFKPVTSRDKLPKGFKSDFDEFARARMRALTGQVDAKTTYQQWLSSQGAAFQDDILGKARGKLFRKGNLTLEKFVNQKGDQIPLRELAKKHKKAFRDAGLDPEKFFD